jgi:hypothetical protein
MAPRDVRGGDQAGDRAGADERGVDKRDFEAGRRWCGGQLLLQPRIQ